MARKDISEYIRCGIVAEKYSKLGLACIKDFEKEIFSVTDKDKIKGIISYYKDKISKTRIKHALSSWLPVGTTVILPSLLISKISNIDMGFFYFCAASMIQLTDWTAIVRKMKREVSDLNGTWHSYYRYESEFNKRLKSIEDKLKEED